MKKVKYHGVTALLLEQLVTDPKAFVHFSLPP
jgi:hypothetical protein